MLVNMRIINNNFVVLIKKKKISRKYQKNIIYVKKYIVFVRNYIIFVKNEN